MKVGDDEAVAVPQILYNVPGRTAVDMLPETVVRLAEISNIIGIKEATGDLSRGQEILDQRHAIKLNTLAMRRKMYYDNRNNLNLMG